MGSECLLGIVCFAEECQKGLHSCVLRQMTSSTINTMSTYPVVSDRKTYTQNTPMIKMKLSRSRQGVGDKPMSCKPGVARSIPGFSQSVG